MIDKLKLLRLVEYLESRKLFDKAAEVLQIVGDYNGAAKKYEKAARKCQRENDYERARLYYINAADCYDEMDMDEKAESCMEHHNVCAKLISSEKRTETQEGLGETIAGSINRLGDKIEASSDTTLKGFTLLSRSIDSFSANLSNTLKANIMAQIEGLLNGFMMFSESQRESALAISDSIFRGFESLSQAERETASKQAEALLEGFDRLSNAEREGRLIQAFATLSGAQVLSDSTAKGLKETAQSIANGFENLSETEQKKALIQAKSIFESTALYTKNFKEVSELQMRANSENIERQMDSLYKGFQTLAQSNILSAQIGEKSTWRGARRIAASQWGAQLSEGIFKGLLHEISGNIFRKGIRQTMLSEK